MNLIAIAYPRFFFELPGPSASMGLYAARAYLDRNGSMVRGSRSCLTHPAGFDAATNCLADRGGLYAIARRLFGQGTYLCCGSLSLCPSVTASNNRRTRDSRGGVSRTSRDLLGNLVCGNYVGARTKFPKTSRGLTGRDTRLRIHHLTEHTE